MQTTANVSVRVATFGSGYETVELSNINGVTVQDGLVFFWAEAGSPVNGEKEMSTMVFMVPASRLVYMDQRSGDVRD